MVETERGCGWRKIGGSYLTADEGMPVKCDALPVEIKPCECCEYEIHHARSLVPYHVGYLASLLKHHKCNDAFDCPLCYYATDYHQAKIENDRRRRWNLTHPTEEKPLLQIPESFFVMWVSKEFYSPESFIAEAQQQGISKRVAANSLPVGFVVGRDWVFLAHGEVPFARFSDKPAPIVAAPDGEFCEGAKEVERVFRSAIFYAFKPQRLELVLWKGTPDDTIRAYEEVGYHVVLVEKTEENLKRHKDGAYPPLPSGKGRAVRKVPLKGGMSGPKKDMQSHAMRHSIPTRDSFRSDLEGADE